jgi:hypothetical protein
MSKAIQLEEKQQHPSEELFWHFKQITKKTSVSLTSAKALSLGARSDDANASRADGNETAADLERSCAV